MESARGISEVKYYKESGNEGVISKKRGVPSNRKISEKTKKEITDLLLEKYRCCNAEMAYEKLNEEGYIVSKETVDLSEEN